LLRELVDAYLSPRFELEEYAFTWDNERVESSERLDLDSFTNWPGQVVLRVAGLNVHSFFRYETGCHIWRSLSAGSDVLRVSVSPAAEGRTAAELLQQRLAQKSDFDQALQQGRADLPLNPQSLLPLVREYRFDPPSAGCASVPIEFNDYSLGYSGSISAPSLKECLNRLWILGRSASEDGC
jgi:hypothetical protein